MTIQVHEYVSQDGKQVCKHCGLAKQQGNRALWCPRKAQARAARVDSHRVAAKLKPATHTTVGAVLKALDDMIDFERIRIAEYRERFQDTLASLDIAITRLEHREPLGVDSTDALASHIARIQRSAARVDALIFAKRDLGAHLITPEEPHDE